MRVKLFFLTTTDSRVVEEGRAGCLAFIVFWMSCYCKCPVALPHCAVGWSAVCDCGISYSLIFLFQNVVFLTEVFTL